MAWVFGIAAEFGGDELAATSFAEHFKQVLLPRVGSAQRRFKDAEGNNWVHVYGQPAQEESLCRQQLNELALEIGGFRYALAGLETDEFRTYSELIEDLGEFFPGLILHASIIEEKGPLAAFQKVSENYWAS